MSRERVADALQALERAINDDDHKADAHIEVVGDMKELSIYLDTDDEPVAIITIYPPAG